MSEICCRGLLFTLIGRTDFSSDDAIWRPRSSRWYLSHCRRESDWVLGFNEATLYDDALFWDELTEEDVDRLTSEEFRPQVRSSILVAFITIFYKKKIFLVHKKSNFHQSYESTRFKMKKLTNAFYRTSRLLKNKSHRIFESGDKSRFWMIICFPQKLHANMICKYSLIHSLNLIYNNKYQKV